MESPAARPRVEIVPLETTPALTIRAAMALHFVRRMGPLVVVVAVYLLVATAVMRWDMARTGEATKDFGDSLYAMFTQLFFQPSAPLPRAPIARALFWLSPLVGAVLLAEGLIKLGAELFDANARHKVWVRIMSEKMRDHVVVCGLGHVGYRVVEELVRFGAPIVAIERRGADSFVDAVRAMGIPVHVDDARRDEVLIAAGVERARAVVCATDDDLANLEVAIDAKRMNPSVRVVMRMFDQRLAGKVGAALEVDRTFSTSALSAPLVALQATQRGIRAVYRLEDGTTRVTVEIVAGARFVKQRVDELEEKLDARIISIRRGDEDGFARVKSTTNVRPGDVVILDTVVAKLTDARRALDGSFRDPPLDLAGSESIARPAES